MPKITVKTGQPHDGTYELDLTHFTWRERAFITELSGTLPPDYTAKWFGQDPKTVIATVAVMMDRANVVCDVDVLLDSDSAESILIDYSDLPKAEPDPTPPPSDAAAPPGNDAE